MERITAMPEASAEVSGDNRHPEIKGRIEFYGVYGGTVVVAEVSGLTEAGTGQEGFMDSIFMKEQAVPESNPIRLQIQEVIITRGISRIPNTQGIFRLCSPMRERRGCPSIRPAFSRRM